MLVSEFYHGTVMRVPLQVLEQSMWAFPFTAPSVPLDVGSARLSGSLCILSPLHSLYCGYIIVAIDWLMSPCCDFSILEMFQATLQLTAWKKKSKLKFIITESKYNV